MKKLIEGFLVKEKFIIHVLIVERYEFYLYHCTNKNGRKCYVEVVVEDEGFTYTVFK